MSSSSPWIEVGALAKAFKRDSYALSTSDALAGCELTLRHDGGRAVSYRFLEADRLRYDDGVSAAQEVAARVTSIRPNIFLVDHRTGRASADSLVLDLDSGSALSVAGALPHRDDVLRSMRERLDAGLQLTAVSAIVRTASIEGNGAVDGLPFQESDDLLGAHNRYVYSPHEVYDHIYLNRNFYAWHCIRGAEAGLADVDRCQTYRISDGLYLFLWREKIVPTLGLVLIDLEQGRTDGKIMGYQDNQFAEVVSFPMGARIVPLTRLQGLGNSGD